jgi:chromosome segregation ATPase
VSIKQSPILHNWLAIGSVAFGVSCVGTLPFTQNLAQSALISLATMPGVVIGTIFGSRQRHRQLNRQMVRGRLRLNELQQQGQILNEQLRVRGKDCQEIESRVSRLSSLAANLTDRTNRDRHQQQQLEQQLVSLDLYCQERQDFATKLDRKIQDKQAQILELETNFNSFNLDLAQLQLEQDLAVTQLDNQSKISLEQIQAEIDRSTIIKQLLEQQIGELQIQQELENDNFAKSIEQQHLLLHQLDLAIGTRQDIEQNIGIEIERLGEIAAARSLELTMQEQSLTDARSQLSVVELELIDKQDRLNDLVTETITKNNEIESCDRELKTAKLELSSRKAELDNLELKVHAKLQQIEEINLEKSLQILDPQPPTIDRSINEIGVEKEWYDRFTDNPHLTILQHIEKHGTITETEASSKLGNARSVRQFANKLEEYAQDLPFSIRVESSPKGNRYLKETQH